MEETMFERLREVSLAVALAALVAFGATPAWSQILVLSSDVEGLKANTELGANERLKVPAGRSVRILLPSGSTSVVQGPMDKPVSELTAGETRLEGLWQLVKNTLGSGRSDRPAAARALNPAPRPAERGPLAVSALLSWTVIPIPATNEGAICVLTGTPLSFARLDAVPSNDAKPIVRFGLGDKLPENPAVVTWKANDERAPWPEGVQAFDGGRYYAAANFTAPSKFELKMIERANVDGNQLLVVLYRNKCFEQVQAWLKSGGKRQ
jgi:hypothetical protein